MIGQHVGLDRLGALSNGRKKGMRKRKKGKRVPKKLKREEGGRGKVQKLDGCRVSFCALFIPSPSSSLLLSSSSPLLSSQYHC
jgi:hypothetical protein